MWNPRNWFTRNAGRWQLLPSSKVCHWRGSRNQSCTWCLPLSHAVRLSLSSWFILLTNIVHSYLAVVINGVKNPHRGEVAQDIRDSILKSPAGSDGPARYWSKDEQETRLIAAYEKWSSHGSVWSAAAPKVRKWTLTNFRPIITNS